MLMFLSRGIVLSLALPYGDPLDEPFHYSYASYLWQTGRPPGSRTLSMPAEVARPFDVFPWYVSFGQRPITWRGVTELSSTDNQSRRQRAFSYRAPDRSTFVAANYESQQPPLGYLLTGWPLLLLSTASLSTRLLALRLAAAVAATAALAPVLALCRRVLPEQAARGALLAIACFPGLGMFLGRYTNDAVAFAFVALILNEMLRLRDDGSPWWNACGLGVLIAAGVWVKLYVLVLIPLLPLAGLLAEPKARRTVFRRAVGAGVLALLLAAPWFAHQLRDSGDLTGMTETKAAAASGVGLPAAVRAIPSVLTKPFVVAFWRSFLWPGTWSAIGAVKPARRLLLVGFLLVLAGTLRGIRLDDGQRRRALLMACAVMFFLAGQALHAGMFKAAADATGTGPLAGGEGWYLLVLLPAVVLSLGSCGRFPVPRVLRATAAVFVAANLLLILGVLPLIYLDDAAPIAQSAGLRAYGHVIGSFPAAFRVLGAVGLGGSASWVAAAIGLWIVSIVAAFRETIGRGDDECDSGGSGCAQFFRPIRVHRKTVRNGLFLKPSASKL